MIKLPKIITKTLSVRLSLMVVTATALLLLLSLAIVFHFSRKALREEALENAEQTLEGTVQHIDNILLSVEQAVGNVYWDMLSHIDNPERMQQYKRKLEECSPYIISCTILFEPGFAEQDTTGIQHYFGQDWYKIPMETGRGGWFGPLKDDEVDGEAVTSFCLPIFNKERKTVGVIAADVSIGLLSQIILSTKPSPNGYATLLDRQGSYIVHPDTNKLLHQTAFTQTEGGANPSVREAVEAMVGGETGHKRFTLDGRDSYVFYKPFQRAKVPGRIMEKHGWSVGVIYPEEDVFGEYNNLLYVVLAIAIASLVLFYLCCRYITHRQLMPLRMLTKSAQHITQGNYNESIPNSNRVDEIGQLQDCFQQMQQSLSAHISELQKLTAKLQEHGDGLRQVYQKTQEAERMKVAFLHHMTNQMMEPAHQIAERVNTICEGQADSRVVEREVDNIQSRSKSITDALNHLLDAADKEKGKEVSHAE